MEKIVHCTTNTTSWCVVAEDGSLYTTIANLLAANKKAFPNLIKGQNLVSLEVSCENGSGAAGSAFYFARNKLDAALPTDNTADLNFASGQKEILPGVNPRIGQYERTYNVWVRKLAGTDEVILVGRY